MRKSRLKILPARSLLTLGFLLLYLSCPTIGEMFRVQPDYGFKSFDQPELKCYTRLTETEDSLLISPSVDFKRLNRTDKDKDTDTFGSLKYGYMNKTYSNAGEGPTTTVVFLDRFKQFEPFVARDKNSVESSVKEQGKLNLSRHLKSREFSLTRKRSLYRALIHSSEKFNRLVVRKQQSLWMRNAKYGSRENDANGKSAKQAYLRRYENRQNSETKQRKSTVNSETTRQKQYRRLVRDRESSSRSIKLLNDRRKFKLDTLQSRDLTHRRVVRSLSQYRANQKSLLLRSDNLTFRRSLHNSVDSGESQTKRSVNQQNRSTFRRVSVSETPNLEKFNERQIKTNYASYERENNLRLSRSIRQTSNRNQVDFRDGTERFSRRTTNKATRTRVVSNVSERPAYFPTDNLTHRRSLFRRDSVNSRVSQKGSVERNLNRDISSRKVNNEPVISRRESRERLSAERNKRMSERQHIVKPSIMRAASEPVTSRDRRNVLIKQRYFKSDKSVSLRVSSEQNDIRRISRERISKHRYTEERHTASETRELIANSRKQTIQSRGIANILVSPRVLSQHSEGKRISNERKNEHFDNRGSSRNGRMSRERSELVISVPVPRTSRRISIKGVSSERLLKTSRNRSAERRYLTGSRILEARDIVSTRQLNNEPVSSMRHVPERMNSRVGASPALTNSRHVFIEKLSERKKYDERYRIKPINKRITSRMFQNNPKHSSLKRLVSERPDVLRVSNGFKEKSARRHLLLTRERHFQMRRSVLEKATSRRFYVKNSYTSNNYNDAENTRPTERFVRIVVNRIAKGEEHTELKRHVSLERSLSHRVRSSDFSDRREAERRMSRTARERITSHALTMKSRSFERSSGHYKFPRHITTGRFTTVMLSERKNLLTRRLFGSNTNKREQNIKHFVGEFKNSSAASQYSAFGIQHTGHTTFRIESSAAINYFTKHSQRGILRNVEDNVTNNKYVLNKEANRYVHNSFETNVNCNLSENSKFNSVTSSVYQVKLCSNLQNTHSLFTSVPSAINKDAYTKIHNISKLQQKQNGNWIHIILEPVKQMMFLLAILLSVKHDKMWSLQSFSNALLDLLMDPDSKYSTTDLKELKGKVRDYRFDLYDSKKILENGPSRFWITNLL